MFSGKLFEFCVGHLHTCAGRIDGDVSASTEIVSQVAVFGGPSLGGRILLGLVLAVSLEG